VRFVEILKPGELQFYLIVGGAALVVLALLLYFLPLRRLRVPAVFGCSLGALALGFGLGVGALIASGYHKEDAEKREVATASGGGEPALAPPRRGGGPGRGGEGGGPGRGGPGRGGSGRGGPGRGSGGGRGNPPGQAPTASSQLASLIVKLDLLTHQAPAVTLTSQEKARIAQELKGLDEPNKVLSEDEAKHHLDSLLETLQSHKQTLEDAGFRWPGEAPRNAPAGTDSSNPFRDQKNAEHLKSLEKSL
jgi:hypothetical protein